MNAPISEFMGAALGTPETSQPAPSGHPDMDKPYAYEFGRTDHEGRFKVVIEHRYPTHGKSDWPIVPLFRLPAPDGCPWRCSKCDCSGRQRPHLN